MLQPLHSTSLIRYIQSKCTLDSHRHKGHFYRIFRGAHPNKALLVAVCQCFLSTPLKAFISLLQLPPDVLVDCMRLMQHELSPNVELNHRWTAQLCLTVPPSYIHFLPVGNSSIITINRPPQGPQMPQPQFITIFVIQLKSLGGRNMQEVTIPLKYDHNTHSTGINQKHFQVK